MAAIRHFSFLGILCKLSFQAKLTSLKEEKEKEIKSLLIRCQESEKSKLLDEKEEKKNEASGDKNKIKQLTAEAKKLNVS